jgi:ribosome-associated toxin RatA of RatAB toxin-antitoxin module
LALVKKSALVMHSAEEMYRLVVDVDQYQRFLPWCRSSRRLSGDATQVCGEIEVERIGIRQKFSTCNRLTPFERIGIQLKEGPFKELSGEWRFIALRENACRVELELRFEFSGRLINSAFGAVFNQIANTLVDAFCKRADEVYGGR